MVEVLPELVLISQFKKQKQRTFGDSMFGA